MSRDRSRKQSVSAVVPLKELDDGISNCWENMQDGGTSRKPDNTLLVNVFHMFNAGLQARPFWQYVASAANIADMPSRNDFELLMALNSSFMPTIIPPTGSKIRVNFGPRSPFHGAQML